MQPPSPVSASTSTKEPSMSHKKPKGKPNRTPSPSAQQASSVDAAVDALQALTGIATGDGRPCEIRVLRMPGRRHICTITPDQMTADEFAATFGSGDYLLQLAPVGGGSIIAGPTYSVDALWGEGNVDRINALFRGCAQPIRNQRGRYTRFSTGSTERATGIGDNADAVPETS